MQQALPFAGTNNMTPMMKQYIDIKSQHRDAILFYRMGDFYEMFFEDARVAAPILGIALTKRGQHLEQDIPMCGVPFHSSDSYISKLIGAGYKVAICEQLETPEEAKKRGYKAVVKREVVRIITSGTITEDNLLDSKASNFLIAIADFKGEIAVAWIDISTAEFCTSKTDLSSLSSDLARISPREILISDKLFNQDNLVEILAEYRRLTTIQSNNIFELNRAEHKIRQYFEVISSDVFGVYSPSQIIACGVILEYIELTQKKTEIKIPHPKLINNAHYMSIDAASRNSLELFKNIEGGRRTSLFNLIDKTKTNAGSRLLSQYLSTPLIDVTAINKRLDLVGFFISNYELSSRIAILLTRVGDIERSISRLGFNRGGPRDLQVIMLTIGAAQEILMEFICFKGNVDACLQANLDNFKNFEFLFEELSNALGEKLPMLARDGGFIREGYNYKIDELRSFKQNSDQAIGELKHRYIQETGVSNLKISLNNVIGYFIDVTPQNSAKMNNSSFIHRQTLANSVRYTTIELKELENEINNVERNILNLELELYEQLVEVILEKSESLNLMAYSLSIIDVAIGFAELAKDNNYVRPALNESKDFIIKNGRHPVIEEALRREKKDFIANDCDLSVNNSLWLITGPNMAGKSTYLRQNAILAILAQIGSFVPAESMKIGIIDKIFSRVGAADDLARGRSTFMVEMAETANIINNATERSLIILDEIGRGTSTYDGVSIASACLEYIHNKLKCRALFATHYHELTALQNQLENLECYTMKITEWQDKVIFMHKVIPGIADKSYGIHVAELAGLPRSLILRAKNILLSLEKTHDNSIKIDISNNLPEEIKNHEVTRLLEEIDTDALSPREALEILYKLKLMI